MGKDLQSKLLPVRERQRLNGAISSATIGVLVGAAIVLVCAAVRWFGEVNISVLSMLGILVITPALGYAIGFLRQNSLREAAIAVDSHYRLKDRATSALAFIDTQRTDDVHQLAVTDAMSHLSKIKPADVVPLRSPKTLPYAIASMAFAVALVFLSTPPTVIKAEPVQPLAVVVAQAEKMAEELKALEEFAKENNDKEIEKLVKDLKEVMEEMKKPDVDLREALAKLSEMESALQQQQGKYNVAEVDAQMKSLGEALSLSEAMSSVGKALEKNQLEKAAEDLPKLDAPELDRQTEKAMKEKLEKLSKQMQDSGNGKLSEATKNLSEGLGGDKNRFKEAAGKLASEAHKQSKRKKLTDLLRKQCQSCSECKGECECERKGDAESKKAGGKNWGLGKGSKELGDQTAKLGSKQEMKLTGKHSNEGDVETETSNSPEGKQEAKREYREAYNKYRKISEAVLESEPIPLGHRQTIRRYFESIRPQEDGAKEKEAPATK